MCAQLPASSFQETLETISRYKLASQLDPSTFELRFENQRDKGIDLIVEIKQNDFYTGFRFAVQLKSTTSVKPAKDGSLPFSIEISNLNYLLNFGKPAYYILYNHTADQFYIEHVAEVYRSLLQKYPAGQFPKTYTINFTRLLTRENIDEVYRQTFESGTILKRLSPHIYFSSKQSGDRKGILIDGDNEVYSVEQNIAFIEHFGFELINKKEFAQIVEIEQRTHPKTKASAAFNLICGLAYYQQAGLFKAIELLKLAEEDIAELTSEAKGLLNYFLLHTRYLLGIIDRDTLRSGTAAVAAAESAGTYLKLEHSYQQFFTKGGTPGEKITLFYHDCNRLIAEDKDRPAMRINAYAKLLNAEADLLLFELTVNYTQTLGRSKDVFRELINRDWDNFDRQINAQYKSLSEFAFKQQDFLAMNTLMMDNIEYTYEKAYQFFAFENWKPGTSDISGDIAGPTRKRLEHALFVLTKVEEAFRMLLQIENLQACLSLKYQLLDFLGEYEKAGETVKEIHQLIGKHEMNALKKSYQNLMEGRIKRQLFYEILNEKMVRIQEIARQMNIEKHLFEDVDSTMNDHFKRYPQWSLTALFLLDIPADDQPEN